MLSHIKKAALELNINPKVLEEAFRHLSLAMKEVMQYPEMPKVLINGFGTFQVTSARLDVRIREVIKGYKFGKLDREETKEKLEYLFKARRRLKNEERRRFRSKKQRIYRRKKFQGM